MIVFRRRLVFWLIRAYLRKHQKAILFFFLVGISLFFLLQFAVGFVANKLPTKLNEVVGIASVDTTLQTLPLPVLNDISQGLTVVGKDGVIRPGLATSWDILDDGKTYQFRLREKMRYTDGTTFTGKTVSYNFTDASVSSPSTYTIIYKLKEPYAPFLTTVSRPMLKNGLVGVGGEFKIIDVKLNGQFVKTLVLESIKNRFFTRTYQFYDTVEALKTAYALGEITKASGLSDTTYKTTNFDTFQNSVIQKTTNYDQLVTVFFNTQDPVISDKKIRSALSYAVPDKFSLGERSSSPFPPMSWAYDETESLRRLDIEHAKDLLKSSSATTSGTLNLEAKVLPKYIPAANEVAKAWKDIDVSLKITPVDSLPADFQLFIGDYTLPNDPDQYSLWHSNQPNNLALYKNLRIDKLLEDGRKITDIDKRRKIYSDFQKYLIDDSPALFLYFPYQYNLSRR